MSLGLTMKKVCASLLVFVLLFSSLGGIASASVNTNDVKIDKIQVDNQIVTYTTDENDFSHSIKIEENYGVTSIVTNKITNEVDVTSTFLDANTTQEMEKEIEEVLQLESDIQNIYSDDISTFAWSSWGPKFNGSTALQNRTYAIILGMLAAALGKVPQLAVPTAGLASYVGTKKTIYWTKQSRMNPDESGVEIDLRVWTYKDSARKLQLGYKNHKYYHSL